MPDASLSKAAEAAALAAFPSDPIGRRALVALALAYADASAPVLVTEGLGHGATAIVASPRPASFHSGRFHGSVAGFAFVGAATDPLPPISIRNTELGLGLAKALMRLSVTPARRGVEPRDTPTSLAPHTFESPGWDALVGAVATLLQERAGRGTISLRLPYECDAERTEEGSLRVTQVLKGRERHSAHSSHLAAEIPSECRQERRVAAGRVIIELPARCVAWPAYARSVVLPIAKPALDAHRQRSAATFADFRSRLDRIVSDGMRETGSSDAALYRWLHASGDLRARLNRRQSLAAYPILSRMLDKPAIAEAIDAERPLPVAIAEAMETSVAAAKRLAGIGDTEDGFLRSLVGILPDTSAIDPRRLPAAGGTESLADQWRGLRDVILAWRELSRNSLAMMPVSPGSVSAKVAVEPATWQRSGGPAVCAGLYRDSNDADDFARAFVRQVLLPIAIDASPVPAEGCLGFLQGALTTPCADGRSILSTALLRDNDLAALVRFSGTWHERYPAIDASLKLGQVAEALTWLPLSGRFQAPGGIELVPLTTPEALATEGRTLRHCVGSYVLSCLEEGSHIVSLRASGVPLSTVEIVLEGDGYAPRVVQHCGPRNDDAPPEAARALSAYLAAIAEGSVRIDGAALETARKERVRDLVGGAAARSVGYDFTDVARRDLALGLYGFALPRDEAGMTHADWSARLGLPRRLDEAMRAHAQDFHRRRDLRRVCDDEHMPALEAWLKEPTATPFPPR